MPKITYKESTLNDQASIIKYNHREEYYLRIKKEGKKYANFSLKTTDLEVARKDALNVFVANHALPARRRGSKYLFATACEKFLEKKQERVDMRLLRPRSYDSYHQRIYQRILPFAKATGIIKVSDIDRDSWRDKYFTFYRTKRTKGKWNAASEGLSITTINSDISTIKELLNWMIEEQLVDSNKILLPKQENDNRNMQEEANPAYMPDSWQKFKTALYEWEKEIDGQGVGLKYGWNNYDDEERAWKKTWLKHYVLFQYHLGARPDETTKILFQHTSYKTLDNGQKKGIVYIVPMNKRGKRTSIMNGHTLLNIKYHLNKGIKIRNKQVAEFNKMIDEKFSSLSTDQLCKRFRRINPETRRWEEHPPASDKDPIMLNPFRKEDDWKMFSVQTIADWYKEILAKSGLTEPFTVYSLRSTHITHAILDGIRSGKTTASIKVLVADNCGTSEAEINRTYRRLNNILNMDLLGFHKSKEVVVTPDGFDYFSEE